MCYGEGKPVTICLSGCANRGAMETPPVCPSVSQGLNIISSTHTQIVFCYVIEQAILVMLTIFWLEQSEIKKNKKRLLHYIRSSFLSKCTGDKRFPTIIVKCLRMKKKRETPEPDSGS